MKTHAIVAIVLHPLTQVQNLFVHALVRTDLFDIIVPIALVDEALQHLSLLGVTLDLCAQLEQFIT